MTIPASARPDGPTEASDGGLAPGQYVPAVDVSLRPSVPPADGDEDDSAQPDRPGWQDGAGDSKPGDDKYVPM
jgi:hypothetical protein